MLMSPNNFKQKVAPHFVTNHINIEEVGGGGILKKKRKCGGIKNEWFRFFVRRRQVENLVGYILCELNLETFDVPSDGKMEREANKNDEEATAVGKKQAAGAQIMKDEG